MVKICINELKPFSIWTNWFPITKTSQEISACSGIKTAVTILSVWNRIQFICIHEWRLCRGRYEKKTLTRKYSIHVLEAWNSRKIESQTVAISIKCCIRKGSMITEHFSSSSNTSEYRRFESRSQHLMSSEFVPHVNPGTAHVRQATITSIFS
jgi:hypothetical protein